MEKLIQETLKKPEIFWIAIGSLATAFALIYTIFLREFLREKKNIKNIKKSLELEIISNIDMLFRGEVERQPLFDIIYLVRTKFVHKITNQKIFYKIQKLYNELDYYKTFVNNVYMKPHIQDNGFYVTEKQLQISNSFLEYFGENPIEYDLSERNEWNEKHDGMEYIDFKRDKAIEIKNRKLEWWERKIKNDIELMFR